MPYGYIAQYSSEWTGFHIFGDREEQSSVGHFVHLCEQRETFDEAKLLVVTKPVADLVMKGAWQDLLILARWRMPGAPLFESFPDPEWLQECEWISDVGFTPTEITSERVQTLMSNLRRWLPIIMAESGDAESERQHVEMALQGP